MWPEHSQTLELLNLAGQGNQAAINRLLERHRNALRRAVELRLDKALRRRVDASDIVQDVLLEANRRLAAYLENPVLPFHLWLHNMARDRIIDSHRRHRGAARRSLDREQSLQVTGGAEHSTLNLDGRLVDPELTPAADAVWKELQVRFQTAVEELEEQDREIVILRHFEQLSNADVAKLLGLAPPAASMRYLRAMRRLRGLLGDHSSDSVGDSE